MQGMFQEYNPTGQYAENNIPRIQASPVSQVPPHRLKSRDSKTRARCEGDFLIIDQWPRGLFSNGKPQRSIQTINLREVRNIKVEFVRSKIFIILIFFTLPTVLFPLLFLYLFLSDENVIIYFEAEMPVVGTFFTSGSRGSTSGRGVKIKGTSVTFPGLRLEDAIPFGNHLIKKLHDLE